MPSPPDNKIYDKDLTKVSIQSKILGKLKLESKEFVEFPASSEGLPPNDEEVMIPDSHQPGMTKHLSYPPPAPLHNEEGLILPKKPMNPCLESADRQNLHRELMFNQKMGKNVLNQKSELQRALEKHKDNQVKKELEHQMTQSTPELAKVIADRAKRLQDVPVQNEDDKGLSKEFLLARAKLRARNEAK